MKTMHGAPDEDYPEFNHIGITYGEGILNGWN